MVSGGSKAGRGRGKAGRGGGHAEAHGRAKAHGKRSESPSEPLSWSATLCPPEGGIPPDLFEPVRVISKSPNDREKQPAGLASLSESRLMRVPVLRRSCPSAAAPRRAPLRRRARSLLITTRLLRRGAKAGAIFFARSWARSGCLGRPRDGTFERLSCR